MSNVGILLFPDVLLITGTGTAQTVYIASSATPMQFGTPVSTGGKYWSAAANTVFRCDELTKVLFAVQSPVRWLVPNHTYVLVLLCRLTVSQPAVTGQVCCATATVTFGFEFQVNSNNVHTYVVPFNTASASTAQQIGTAD